jgi:hypothetical protein
MAKALANFAALLYNVLLQVDVGGPSMISEDSYIEGAPELVAVIATSNAAIDLGAKQNAYRRWSTGILSVANL